MHSWPWGLVTIRHSHERFPREWPVAACDREGWKPGGLGRSRFRPGRGPTQVVSAVRCGGGLSPGYPLPCPTSQVTSASPSVPWSHVSFPFAQPGAGGGSRICPGRGGGNEFQTTATYPGLRRTRQDLGQGARSGEHMPGIACHEFSPRSGATVLVPSTCDPAVVLGLWSAGGGTCPVRGEVKSEPRSARTKARPS